VEDDVDKLKTYINEISLLSERDSFNYTALKNCYDSFELSDEQTGRLKQIARGHIKHSEDMLKGGRIEEALSSTERAVEILPLSSEFRNRIAQLYLIKSRNEGLGGKNREAARSQASFSLKIEPGNPIAGQILKEINQKERSLSGKTSYRKLIFPLAGLLMLIVAAIFSQNDFTFTFLRRQPEVANDSMAVPALKKTETFSGRELETILTGQLEECRLEVERSLLGRTNGSISYTLQGTFFNESKAVKSADLNIAFKKFDDSTLFEKTLPLIREDQWLMPGEPALIDSFFYVHYLPPEIEEVRISLKNLLIADEIPRLEERQKLPLEWTASRPEGVKIDVFRLDANGFQGYGEDFINIKLMMDNSGTEEINRFEVDLKWRDLSGVEIHSLSQNLIDEGNPVLEPENSRIFRVFTSLPSGSLESEPEMYINVTRINS